MNHLVVSLIEAPRRGTYSRIRFDRMLKPLSKTDNTALANQCLLARGDSSEPTVSDIHFVS